MNRKWKITISLLVGSALILDSATAAEAAGKSLELCEKNLIPGLFPLFVLSSLLVPQLSGARLPWLSKLLGMAKGAEDIFLLGCAGGFPVGAACIVQAHRGGSLSKSDAERMLGLCSFCGPSFLFGVIGTLLGQRAAGAIFLIQLEAALLLCALWPGPSDAEFHGGQAEIILPEAVQRAIASMCSVCAWVVLAGVLSGYLKQWLFPLLPEIAGILLTGLTELTGGVFALGGQSQEAQFLLCTIFACFGGISVLLQIGGLASGAGLSMENCILQKAAHGLLGGLLAGSYLRFGVAALLVVPGLLLFKIAVEISGKMVYHVGRKEGM